MNQRLSNIELLRCLSMFMVLLLHSSFMVYGMPDSLEINKAPGFWGAFGLPYVWQLILPLGVCLLTISILMLFTTIKVKLYNGRIKNS